MPPPRQPIKLFKICNDYINSFIIKIIITISAEGDKEADSKLQTLQEYIASNINPHLIDNLLQTVDHCGRLNDSQQIMLLNVLMHPAIVTFNTLFKLPSNDLFYEVRLRELKNLVVLNLNMVCTDELLEVVGNNCSFVQVIYIVSKIGSVASKTKRQLNALKLKYFVSDKGLEHLHKCKFLKTVVMNKVIRSNCGGRKITHNGIRRLISALSYLQFISYNDMGFVLKDGINDEERFNLLHLHDSHINPSHMDAFFKHCPNLRGLCLMLPTTGFNNSDPETCLSKLTTSKLNVTSLALGLFPMDNEFIHLLNAKGRHLTTLYLFNFITISLETVYFIGVYCPLIEYLEVNLVLPGPRDKNIKNSIANNQFFSHLQCLKLIGSNWDPHLVFPLCINSAPNLNQLVLVNKDYNQFIDTVVSNVVQNRALLNLRSVSLLEGFHVTVKTLTDLILHLEHLESITVTKGSGYIDHLEQLKLDNNLMLNIKSDFMTKNYSISYENCLCYHWQLGCSKKKYCNS